MEIQVRKTRYKGGYRYECTFAGRSMNFDCPRVDDETEGYMVHGFKQRIASIWAQDLRFVISEVTHERKAKRGA